MSRTNWLFFSAFLIVCSVLWLGLRTGGSGAAAVLPEGLTLHDNRLELALMVEDPQIVTPIGIAVDSLDRVYVLESHTHLPPKGYSGPKGDLIKRWEDTNGDGKLDNVTVFAEGIREGLSLAFSPEGVLYLVTSKQVWAFYDRDGDGKSEDSRLIAELKKPEKVYAHAALLSLTFSPDGWLYIGRGNTGSARWVFEGTDGTQLTGYGDGGNVMRIRWDGSALEEFCTGFWNPFDLKFDSFGRLLVADNDPDSRGPNRLVHAVQHGDYGYKSLFGGSGIHPYLAWNGELPGTLPYAVALGEAPSGLLNANQGRLPADYENQMLCTIWEESSLVRIKIDSSGTTVTGSTELILKGGEEFRPVAFATNSRGEIYFTDWVLRYYPNHGRGKIWKLSAKEGVKTLNRASPAQWKPSAGDFVQAAGKGFEMYRPLLTSPDPFAVHSAVVALGRDAYKPDVLAALRDPDANVRQGALLVVKRMPLSKQERAQLAAGFLTDPDPQIRNAAMIWIGSQQIVELSGALEAALTTGEPSVELFETYLETVKILQPEFVAAYRSESEGYAKTLPRRLPAGFISDLVSDSSRPAKIRAFALRYLDDLSEHEELLVSFLAASNQPEIRLEAVRTIAGNPGEKYADALLRLALSPEGPSMLRSEAILALSRQPLVDWRQLLPLLNDNATDVQVEAARYLGGKVSERAVRQALERRLKRPGIPALTELLKLALGTKQPGRPASSDQPEWLQLLAGPGDTEMGRRVFFSDAAVCSACHTVDGRGGDLGPDLSNVGRSKDRAGLVSSILLPSAEVSPEWQGWYIAMKDGTHYQGRQIDVGDHDIRLYTQAQGFVTLLKRDIADYGMAANSLMPEGLEHNLTTEDLRNLLAFLEAQ